MMITSDHTTLYQRGKEKCSHPHPFTHPTPPYSVSLPVIVIWHDVAIQGQFTKIVTSDVTTNVWRYKEFDWMDWTPDVNIWGQKLKNCTTRPCLKDNFSVEWHVHVSRKDMTTRFLSAKVFFWIKHVHRLFLGFLLSFLLCDSFFLRLKMKRVLCYWVMTFATKKTNGINELQTVKWYLITQFTAL